MNRAKRALSVLLVAGMVLAIAPSGLWAESAIPDAGAFFSGTGLFDPNASGTKLSGTLTIAYDFAPPQGDCATHFINNMFVVVTVAQGNNRKPFNRDFTTTNPVTQPFCFDNQAAQVNFVADLIRDKVIPFFFGCGGTTGIVCPGFQVKSMSNFLSSGTGAVSTDITLAVH